MNPGRRRRFLVLLSVLGTAAAALEARSGRWLGMIGLYLLTTAVIYLIIRRDSRHLPAQDVDRRRGQLHHRGHHDIGPDLARCGRDKE